MWSYNKTKKAFLHDHSDKVVKPNSKDFEKVLVEYVLTKVAEGKSINKVLPEDPDLPTFLELSAILEKPQYADQRSRAMALREQRIVENLVDASENFQKAPTKDNMEYLKILSDVKKQISSKKDKAERITIAFHRFCPPGFWEFEFKPEAEPTFEYNPENKMMEQE